MEQLAFQPSLANVTMDTIFSRRAVRHYKNQSVDRHLIEQVIAAGKMAPSAMNLQPWSFYVLTDQNQISLFSREIMRTAIFRFAKQGVKQLMKSAVNLYHAYQTLGKGLSDDKVFHGAPVVIFITAPRDNEWAATDVGMCAQNMMLAAQSIGLSTCPVGFAQIAEQVKDYSLLRIPVTEKIVLAVVVGYGDEHPELQERRKNNVFFLNA
jgi:nitroreductase